jgi:hypothetical protein
VVVCLVNVEAKALDRLCRTIFLEMSCLGHNVSVPTQWPFQKQLTDKRKDGRFCHLFTEEKYFQNFTMICRKPYVASPISFRATIFQTPEGTLWTYGISALSF